MGMLLEDMSSVINFLCKQKNIIVIMGHFACGVECCGVKLNYKIDKTKTETMFESNDELEFLEEFDSLYGESF